MKDFYLKYIIKQYFQKPKARAEVGLFVDRLIQVNQYILDFYNRFNVDTAVGHQLDLIGKWVGVNRYFLNFEKNPFFAFEDQDKLSYMADNQRDFSYPLRDFVSTLYKDGSLKDEDFRLFIKLKILKNNAKALLFGDNNLQEIINFAFRGNAYIIDNLNMTMTINVIGQEKDYFLEQYILLDIIPRPVGVQYNFKFLTSEFRFGFKGQHMARGFSLIKGDKKAPIINKK